MSPGTARAYARAVSTDRIVLVGIAWTVVLLVLLMLREVLRSSRRPIAKKVLPVLNILTGVMIAAFSVAAILRLGLLVNPTSSSAAPDPGGRAGGARAGGAVARTAVPAPAIEDIAFWALSSPVVTRTPAPSAWDGLVGTPRPTLPPQLVPTPASEVTPEPEVTPATPGATPDAPEPAPSIPGPIASLPLASSAPGASPSAEPVAEAATVGLPRRFLSYTVGDDRITGFVRVSIAAPVRARAGAPQVYRMATFSDPDGSRRLVRVLDGPLAGTLVCPDDPGIAYRPAA